MARLDDLDDLDDLDLPQLSLCLIFRDEEAMLPGFLTAVSGLWDELVAVDTGSLDHSAVLLDAAGARIVPFIWEDDFAAARNCSLEYARGRWILFLDADERPGPDFADAVRALVADPGAGAATVVMRNELPGGHRRESRLLRLFRNDPGIRFRHRIHEDVAEDVAAFLERQGLRLVHLPQVVDHLGYVREVAADRGKKERDLDLLRRSLAENPQDFYCRFKILEIARFWNDRPLWRQEARACARLLAGAPARLQADLRRRPWSGELAALISQELSENDEENLDWLEKSRPWSQESAAWLLRKAALLENLGRLEDAAVCCRRCLQLPDQTSTQLTTARPLLQLCRLALARHDPAAALPLALQAAALAPRDPEALLALLGLEPQAGAQLLQRHLADHPEAAAAAAEMCLGAGQVRRAADLLLPLAHAEGLDDPDAALGLLVCRLVLGEDFDFQVDTDQATTDRLLRRWVRALWRSRQAPLLEAFARGCGAVTGIFPWLPDFLAEETRQLREETS